MLFPYASMVDTHSVKVEFQAQEAHQDSGSLTCLHCGMPTQGLSTVAGQARLPFCCGGCEAAHNLMREWADGEACPLPEGRHGKAIAEVYARLDQQAIMCRLPIVRHGDGLASMSFRLPTMSCVACVKRLNALPQMARGIIRCQVDFPTKTLSVWYNPTFISIGWVAQTLAWEGYPPDLSALIASSEADSVAAPSGSTQYQIANRSRIARLVVAGFAAGNTMMLSFPQYLGLSGQELRVYGPLMEFLTIGLSLLVVIYSAGPWLKAAAQALSKGSLSVDFPIALAVLALLFRSLYDLYFGLSSGYLDSLCGLVFLLLIGQWLQSKYYQKLEFEHEYRSFFPLSFTKQVGLSEWAPVLFTDLEQADVLRIKASEIIPADGVVVAAHEARVETSFLTGESDWKKASVGMALGAGTRVTQGFVHVKLEQRPDASYMSRLWNEADADATDSKQTPTRFEDLFVKYFSGLTLLIAGLAYLYWQWQDPSRALQAATAVLMVACPCALTLALPFASAQAVTLLSQAGLHLKNAEVVTRLAQIDQLLFDKTGTLTQNDGQPNSLIWHDPDGQAYHDIPQHLAVYLKTAAAYSSHPLLQQASAVIGNRVHSLEAVTDFRECLGQGVVFHTPAGVIKIGRFAFVEASLNKEISGSVLAMSIDGQCVGYGTLHQSLRPGVARMLAHWPIPAMVLTGDHDGGVASLALQLGSAIQIYTHQTPSDKRNQVKRLQAQGHHVLMLGDGANDSPAMKSASVSMAVVNERNSFFPSADAVLKGSDLHRLKAWVGFCRLTLKAVKISLVGSLVYNCIGLTWAITGQLSPWLAALFMPLSSLSVVGLAVLLTHWFAKQQRIASPTLST